mmetsp:Transcript_9137/g.27438  ORF Transcript_9137/g.27438 Transcript_9137/m.27438 type:complete len:344 (+) Transcript_9137:580-1611(+)
MKARTQRPAEEEGWGERPPNEAGRRGDGRCRELGREELEQRLGLAGSTRQDGGVESLVPEEKYLGVHEGDAAAKKSADRWLEPRGYGREGFLHGLRAGAAVEDGFRRLGGAAEERGDEAREGAEDEEQGELLEGTAEVDERSLEGQLVLEEQFGHEGRNDGGEEDGADVDGFRSDGVRSHADGPHDAPLGLFLSIDVPTFHVDWIQRLLENFQHKEHSRQGRVETRRHSRCRSARQEEAAPLGRGGHVSLGVPRGGGRGGQLPAKTTHGHSRLHRRSLGTQAVPRTEGDDSRGRLPSIPRQIGDHPPRTRGAPLGTYSTATLVRHPPPARLRRIGVGLRHHPP